MKIRIAELNVDIENRGKYIEKLSEKYLSDFESADISITVTDADIEAELNAVDGQFSKSYCESTAAYRKIGYLLPEFAFFCKFLKAAFCLRWIYFRTFTGSVSLHFSYFILQVLISIAT